MRTKNVKITEPTAKSIDGQQEETSNMNRRMKFKWTNESYQSILQSEHIITFEQYLDQYDIENALASFNNLLQDACIEKHSYRKAKLKETDEWWDEEMDCIKYQKYKCLRTLRQEPSELALIKYKNVRKHYKSTIKLKKMMYKAISRNLEIE